MSKKWWIPPNEGGQCNFANENSQPPIPVGWIEFCFPLQDWGHVINALSSQALAERDWIWKPTRWKGEFFVVVLTCHVMLCVYNQIRRWLPAGSFSVKSASVFKFKGVSLQGWEKKIVVKQCQKPFELSTCKNFKCWNPNLTPSSLTA